MVGQATQVSYNVGLSKRACECCASLMQRGAALDLQQAQGGTALYLVSQMVYLDVVPLFCERGAFLFLDLQVDDGTTARVCASYHSHLDIVRLLCDRGYNTRLVSDCFTAHAAAKTTHGCGAPVTLVPREAPPLNYKKSCILKRQVSFWILLFQTLTGPSPAAQFRGYEGNRGCCDCECRSSSSRHPQGSDGWELSIRIL